jgi:hypothetical protein
MAESLRASLPTMRLNTSLSSVLRVALSHEPRVKPSGSPREMGSPPAEKPVQIETRQGDFLNVVCSLTVGLGDVNNGLHSVGAKSTFRLPDDFHGPVKVAISALNAGHVSNGTLDQMMATIGQKVATSATVSVSTDTTSFESSNVKGVKSWLIMRQIIYVTTGLFLISPQQRAHRLGHAQQRAPLEEGANRKVASPLLIPSYSFAVSRTRAAGTR